MMRQFKIVVPCFNCVDYIEKCLHSIEIQTYKNYEVCIVDDGSTIKKQREIISQYCQKNGWKFLFNEKNFGALYSLVHGIKMFDCLDDDVIAVIDGDDWLAHENALKVVHDVYMNEDIYLTWGQCEKYPAEASPVKFAQPIPDMVIEQKLFREIPFVFRHLGTFKYFLWRQIKDSDLRDTNGEYLRLLKDKATTFPMLEMAGKKIRFISETLYIYNLENPLNDFFSSAPEEFKRVDELIKHRPRYQTLKFPNE